MSWSTTPVQQKQSSIFATGNSVIVTLDAPPTPGNFLAVLVASTQATVTVSSITQTNVTWTAKVIGSSVNRMTEIWKVDNCPASPGSAVTVNFSATISSNTSVWVVEFSGEDTSGSTDQSSSRQATSTSFATASITPTAGRNVLLLTVIRIGATVTAGPTAGFTDFTTSNANYKAAYQAVASASGSYSNTYTANSLAYDAQIADFLAPAAGGATPPGLLAMMGCG